MMSDRQYFVVRVSAVQESYTLLTEHSFLSIAYSVAPVEALKSGIDVQQLAKAQRDSGWDDNDPSLAQLHDGLYQFTSMVSDRPFYHTKNIAYFSAMQPGDIVLVTFPKEEIVNLYQVERVAESSLYPSTELKECFEEPYRFWSDGLWYDNDKVDLGYFAKVKPAGSNTISIPKGEFSDALLQKAGERRCAYACNDYKDEIETLIKRYS